MPLLLRGCAAVVISPDRAQFMLMRKDALSIKIVLPGGKLGYRSPHPIDVIISDSLNRGGIILQRDEIKTYWDIIYPSSTKNTIFRIYLVCLSELRPAKYFEISDRPPSLWYAMANPMQPMLARLEHKIAINKARKALDSFDLQYEELAGHAQQEQFQKAQLHDFARDGPLRVGRLAR